jgi:hypothetical protein
MVKLQKMDYTDPIATICCRALFFPGCKFFIFHVNCIDITSKHVIFLIAEHMSVVAKLSLSFIIIIAISFYHIQKLIAALNACFLSCSCLIARNLLGGMKTCSDVFQYMHYIENSSASGTLSSVDSLVKGYIKVGLTLPLYFFYTLVAS